MKEESISLVLSSSFKQAKLLTASSAFLLLPHSSTFAAPLHCHSSSLSPMVYFLLTEESSTPAPSISTPPGGVGVRIKKEQSMASFKPVTSILFILLLTQFPPVIHSQQPYQGMDALDCNNQQNTTSLLGYFCRGRSNSCQSFLTFHSRPPYQSVPSISALMGADPSLLSEANSVSPNATFDTNIKVIVPVNCSCSGGRFRSNSPYVVREGETGFIIANTTYQGLSTCQAIDAENRDSTSSGFLIPGLEISVPLRCACPNRAQRRSGISYLLSYLVDPDDSVFALSSIFNETATTEQGILDANMLSRANATLYPFTTLLVPVKDTPNRTYFSSWPLDSNLINTRPPSPPPNTTKISSNDTWLHVMIGVSSAAAVLVAASILFLYLALRNRNRRSRVADIPSYIIQNQRKLAKPSPSDIGLKEYSYKDLQSATINFSSECRIGGSSVYRAVLNGAPAAVKVMNRDVSQEVDVYKRINHFNLIRLSGVCLNEGRWYLVYEYAENGSLSSWIFAKGVASTALSWTQRVQIGLDVANGLNYLHTYTRPPFVHKDIKSSNILLDDNFRAKVAKFGSARPAEEEEEEDMEMTRHIVGTKGYMAPEYMELGIVSTKIDVYAFGVVMMELVTGKDVINNAKGRRGDFSPEGLFAAICEGGGDIGKKEKIGGFMDPLLEDKYPTGLAVAMYGLIEQCLREDARRRPSMEKVSQALLKIQGASQSWELKSGEMASKSLSSEAYTPGGTEISRKVASLKSILMRKKKMRRRSGSF